MSKTTNRRVCRSPDWDDYVPEFDVNYFNLDTIQLANLLRLLAQAAQWLQ